MARAALQDTRGHARFRSWARSPGHAPTAGARSSVGTPPPRGPPDPRGLRGPRHQGRRRPAGTGRGVNSEVPPPAARHRGVPDTGTLATASPAGPGSNSGQLPPEGQAGEGHPPRGAPAPPDPGRSQPTGTPGPRTTLLLLFPVHRLRSQGGHLPGHIHCTLTTGLSDLGHKRRENKRARRDATRAHTLRTLKKTHLKSHRPTLVRIHSNARTHARTRSQRPPSPGKRGRPQPDVTLSQPSAGGPHAPRHAPRHAPLAVKDRRPNRPQSLRPRPLQGAPFRHAEPSASSRMARDSTPSTLGEHFCFPPRKQERLLLRGLWPERPSTSLLTGHEADARSLPW